ncbi:MAG: hypothetical protein IKF90_06510 [Parasporobacterium sp.]|nr:hypothetical protein [Parasporobacterium sp.]
MREKHTEEVIRRFKNLPDCRVIFTEKTKDMKAEDLAETEIFVGMISEDLPAKMPKLRFVQLFSAGANNIHMASR